MFDQNQNNLMGNIADMCLQKPQQREDSPSEIRKFGKGDQKKNYFCSTMTGQAQAQIHDDDGEVIDTKPDN